MPLKGMSTSHWDVKTIGVTYREIDILKKTPMHSGYRWYEDLNSKITEHIKFFDR